MEKKEEMNVLVVGSTRYIDIGVSPAKSWAQPICRSHSPPGEGGSAVYR